METVPQPRRLFEDIKAGHSSIVICLENVFMMPGLLEVACVDDPSQTLEVDVYKMVRTRFTSLNLTNLNHEKIADMSVLYPGTGFSVEQFKQYINDMYGKNLGEDDFVSIAYFMNAKLVTEHRYQSNVTDAPSTSQQSSSSHGALEPQIEEPLVSPVLPQKPLFVPAVNADELVVA
jgi:hypothetical protein